MDFSSLDFFFFFPIPASLLGQVLPLQQNIPFRLQGQFPLETILYVSLREGLVDFYPAFLDIQLGTLYFYFCFPLGP